MPTFKERAISDMRIVGHTGSYLTSYAPGDDRYWGPPNNWAGRSTLGMSRYVHTPAGQLCEAFDANVNPDVSYLDFVTDPAARFGVYDRFLVWGQLLVSDSAKSPNTATGWAHNTRAMIFDQEMWQRSKNTGAWTRRSLSNTFNYALYSLNFLESVWLGADARREGSINNYYSFRVTQDAAAPIAPYRIPHWYTNEFVQIGNTADVADLMVAFKVSLVLQDPNGVDDRATSAHMVSAGLDAYLQGANPIIIPGCGISRPRLVRALWPNWEWCVMHTMTEAQINSVGVPPSLANLTEGDDSTPPVDPPAPSPTVADWSALTSPINWATRQVSQVAPTVVKRGRRARMR
jgi:hypothetical protein